MSGFRVTTTAEVAKELGAYGEGRRHEVQRALDALSDSFPLDAEAPAAAPDGPGSGPGWQAELMPGVVFSWVVVPQARLVIVWQATAACSRTPPVGIPRFPGAHVDGRRG